MKNVIQKLNDNKNENHESDQKSRILSEEQKWGVIIGWKHYDSSYDELMIKFDIKSKGTITKLIDKYQKKKNVQNNMQYSGRNSKFDDDICDLVKGFIEDYKFQKYSVSEIQSYINQDYGFLVSKTQIYDEMKKLSVKYGRANIVHQLSDQNKLDRKNHCKKYSYQILDEIVFSDESIFSLRDNKVEIWYSEEFSKNIEVKQYQYADSFIHIWAGVSKRGKTEIFIHDESVNAEQYKLCLEESYLPYLEKQKKVLYSDPILLQDGARPHIANITKQYFEQRKISYIQNPPYSPDLNAIELVWALMKKLFNKANANHQIKDKQELIDFVNAIWEINITQEFINNAIDHVQKVMQYVHENDGIY